MHLGPFKLERYFAHYEFNVRYLLSSSDCESMTIGELLAMEKGADEQFKQHWLGYTESNGSPSLRVEISHIYQTINPDKVLVFNGAEEAIFLFMQTVLQPGDHVIVHRPCYQSLFEVAQGLGCEVSPWLAREQEGWRLDLEELEQMVRPTTRLIVLNTPHNPTGWLMPQDDLEHLCRFTEKRGILLFSDEVYRESEHDPRATLSAACDLSSLAFSLGVTSKTYGLPGLRIGWLATHQNDLLRSISTFKDYTTICNSAPSEFLAEVALRHRLELADRSRCTILNNLVVLDKFFSKYSDVFSWVRPVAGPIGFPRLHGEPADEFCRQLIEQQGVLLLPGSLFDDPGNHFRIGFGRKNLPRAIEKLEEFLLLES